MKKFDIYNFNLNPKKWSVQAWIRPWVIVQSNLFNKYSPTVIMLPLTGNIKKPFPSEFLVEPSKVNWLKSKSRILWSQIITIDKKYIGDKIWVLEEKYIDDVFESLNVSLDLKNEF